MISTSKIKDKKGYAAIILILLVAILIMIVLILYPSFIDLGKSTKDKLDSDYEQTAEDSAYMKYMADGQGFVAVYDSENKTFIDQIASKREFGKITSYGESDDHKGKLILVRVDDSGDISLTWISSDEYWKVNE